MNSIKANAFAAKPFTSIAAPLVVVTISIFLGGCGVSGGPSLISSGSESPDTGGGNQGPLKIFLSSATPANFGGKDQADQLCASDLNKPDPATYKALLAAPGRSAGGGVLSSQSDWVLKPNTAYYRDDGTTLIGTTNANAVFNFPTATAVSSGPPLEVWTGIRYDWTDAPNNCSSWTSTAVAVAVVGMSVVDGDGMIDIQSSRICTSSFRLYCVQQP